MTAPAAPAAPAVPVAAGGQTAQLMGIAVSGTNALARFRSTQSLSGTSITAKLGGIVVGTGTLDANGHAVIMFTAAVPRGSTLVLTAGTATITVMLARTVPATTVSITATATGFTILASGDATGTGNAAPSMSDNDAEDMDEDTNGNVIDVDDPMLTMLPATLQVTIVAACGGIVISPNAAGVLSIRVREQTDDQNNNDGSNAPLDVRGVFTAPATFPIVATAARLRVEVFGQPNEQGPKVVEIRAPIFAVTAGATAPAACPAAFPGTVIMMPTPAPMSPGMMM